MGYNRETGRVNVKCVIAYVQGAHLFLGAFSCCIGGYGLMLLSAYAAVHPWNTFDTDPIAFKIVWVNALGWGSLAFFVIQYLGTSMQHGRGYLFLGNKCANEYCAGLWEPYEVRKSHARRVRAEMTDNMFSIQNELKSIKV